MTPERWKGIKEIIKVYGFGLLAVIAVSVAWDYLQPKPELPEFAPDFTLVDVTGQEHQLSQYRGQTVVLNFWASWCGPCVSEIPDFARYASEHPEVVLLGLASERSETDAVETAERLGAEYPIIMAGSVSSDYDISVLPTTVVVSPDGRVKQVSVGAMSYRALAAAVER
jgi:thiol-disulfide isomerase/thioredoxin